MTIKACGKCGREFRSVDDFLEQTSRWRVCDEGNLWFNCLCNSTLLLLKGKFPWFSPGMGMSGEARSVFNILSERPLPHPPGAMMRLLQTVESETTSSADLEARVRESPALALKVLNLANSARAFRGNSIRSIAHAVSVIGRDALHQLVLAAPFESLKFATQRFRSDAFWQDSRRNAHIAAVLCERLCPEESADEAFVAGFLVDMGKVVQAMYYPDSTDRLCSRVEAMEPPCSWVEAEALEHVHRHEILGEIAACLWGMPEYVRRAATFHHRPAVDEEKDLVADLAAFALQIRHWNFNEPQQVDANTYHRLRRRFSLDDTRAFRLMVDIHAEVRERLRAAEALAS